MWRLHFVADAEANALLVAALEERAAAISAFETAPAGDWRTEALFLDEGEARAAAAELDERVGRARQSVSGCVVELLPARDWLAENRLAFPPIRAGRFFIRGSHIAAPPPPGSIPIRLDAGMAFGSGEHATTRGCLLMLERLARRRGRPQGILDLGTGSGILAIAAAKLCHRRVLAVDIDPRSVEVARENARLNGAAGWISLRRSVGFGAVPRGRRYGLVFANILARPLMQLSRDLACHLRPGGTAILSGLLASQQGAVMAACRRQRLRLVDVIRIGDWPTLAVTKGA